VNEKIKKIILIFAMTIFFLQTLTIDFVYSLVPPQPPIRIPTQVFNQINHIGGITNSGTQSFFMNSFLENLDYGSGGLVHLTPEQYEELQNMDTSMYTIKDIGNRIVDIFTRKTTSNEPLPAKTIETSVGVVDVPYVPVRMSENQLAHLMLNNFYGMKVIDEILEEANYSWCFHCVGIVNDCAHRQPVQTPHPLLLGYCPNSGLPVFDALELPYGMSNINEHTELYKALKQHAAESYITECGGTMTFDGFRNAFGVYEFELLLNGVSVFKHNFILSNNEKPLGFVMVNGNDDYLLRLAIDRVVLNWIDILPLQNRTSRLRQMTGVPNPPTTAPRPATGIGLALDPNQNIINHYEEIMRQISELSTHLDRIEDEIYIRVPIIEPEFFPEISTEEFPAFAEEILRRIRELGNDWDIIRGGETKTYDINIVVDISDLIIPPPPTLPGEYAKQLTDIERQLQRQNNLLEQQNQKLDDYARNIPQRIGDVIVGSPGELDFSPLEELKAIGGVFPFSIPWDLRNAFLAMFGGSVSVSAPVFEIDLTNTILNSKIEIDFSEYERMVIAIRWGIMGLFVMGLVMATGRLIKW